MSEYLSEALIITKCNNLREIQDWLFWYVDVLGFDCVSLYDNESPVDVKSECDKYSNVTYYFHPGVPQQENTYLDHVNKKRRARWVFPVDDDEFLYLSEKYNHSVNTFLKAMEDRVECLGKISVQWVNLVPKEYLEFRDKDSSLLRTHTCISDIAMSHVVPWEGRPMRGYLKTFVRDGYWWSYGFHFGQRRRLCVHNPSSPNYRGRSLMEDGTMVTEGRIGFEYNPDCFLAHYSLRSEQEWQDKCQRATVSCKTATMKNNIRLFSRIYEHTEDFVSCTKLRDLYDMKKQNTTY